MKSILFKILQQKATGVGWPCCRKIPLKDMNYWERRTTRVTHTAVAPCLSLSSAEHTHLVFEFKKLLFFKRVCMFHFVEKKKFFPIEYKLCNVICWLILCPTYKLSLSAWWYSCVVFRWAAKWQWCSSSIFSPPTTSGSWSRACTCTVSSSWPSDQTANTSGLLYSLDGVS